MKTNFQSYMLKTEVAGTSEMWQTAWRHTRPYETQISQTISIHQYGQNLLVLDQDDTSTTASDAAAGDSTTSTSTLQLCNFAVPRSHCLVSPHQQSVRSTRCPTLLNTTRCPTLLKTTQCHSNVRVLGQTQKNYLRMNYVIIWGCAQTVAKIRPHI